MTMGQTGTATISGLVTDESLAIVVKAELELKSVDKGYVTTTTSNNDGIYVLTGIQPGHYQITVRKPGFKQVDFLDLILNTQDHVDQNFRLQVGSVSESVTVNSSPEHIATDDAAVGLLVNRDFVENMPLNGRSFEDLILLTPGALTDGGGFVGSQYGTITVNGQRSDANYFTVDGVSANMSASVTFPAAAGVLPSQTALGTTQGLTSVDGPQEFKIQTSTYAAEYGRQPGGQVEDNVLLRLFGREQQHVNIGLFSLPPYFTANRRSIELRHYPVEQGEPRSVMTAEMFGGRPSVIDGSHFISSALESPLEERTREGIVVGDKNSHHRFFAK
jgi:hypothetical protein